MRELGAGRLTGTTVLVVGAGTRASDDPDAPVGNGRAIAVAAARAGATVVCSDIDADAAAATADMVQAEGGTAHVIVGDVADAETCAALVEQTAALAAASATDTAPAADTGATAAAHGNETTEQAQAESSCQARAAEATRTTSEDTGDRSRWGLVINVGIGQGNPVHGIAGTSVEDWDRTSAVNLRAHFLLARAALARMAPGSSIVFMGSVAGLRPGSSLPAYDATKAGLIGLNRHVALEGARRGIRANVIAPGLIDTPLGRLASAGRPSRSSTFIPLGRQGTAWEVAAVTTFLLSDEASYVTGQVLAVDGGLTLL